MIAAQARALDAQAAQLRAPEVFRDTQVMTESAAELWRSIQPYGIGCGAVLTAIDVWGTAWVMGASAVCS